MCIERRTTTISLGSALLQTSSSQPSASSALYLALHWRGFTASYLTVGCCGLLHLPRARKREAYPTPPPFPVVVRGHNFNLTCSQHVTVLSHRRYLSVATPQALSHLRRGSTEVKHFPWASSIQELARTPWMAYSRLPLATLLFTIFQWQCSDFPPSEVLQTRNQGGQPSS